MPMRFCVLALLVVGIQPVSAQGAGPGWTLERREAADLWYHSLAVIGFEAPDGLARYSADYADRIRSIKAERGDAATTLDGMAADLKSALEADGAFQILHWIPLYFAGASPEQMFAGLEFVILEGFGNTDGLEPATLVGAKRVLPSFVAPRQRRVLRVFVETVKDEWQNFYAEFWQEDARATASALDATRELWTESIQPALRGFLESQHLLEGTVFLSPSLSTLGMIHTPSPDANAAAVWFPSGDMQPTSSAYFIVQRLCSSAVDDAMNAPDVDASQEAWTNASARCGEMVLRHADAQLADNYVAVLLAALDAEGAFEDVYPLDEPLATALAATTDPRAMVASSDRPTTRAGGWVFQPRASTDLWFHTLAVIAADQPGPLGLYSADYANHIRDVKRERGLYPTRLDSLASDLNKRAQGSMGRRATIHFVPVYFPDATVDEMLSALEHPDDADQIRRFGVIGGGTAGLIRDLAAVMRDEWEVFYRDYWRTYETENRYRFDAVQAFWDRALGSLLEPYLEKRGLAGGLAMPSPPVGPEGRIIDPDPFDSRDQVIAMQFPVSANRPEATTFFFLKELCFLIIEDVAYGRFGQGTQDFDNLRRTGAVRCGAMILDEHDPVLALQYRRTFLDAVGADESATMAAFDRVYYLDNSMLARLRAQITMPR